MTLAGYIILFVVTHLIYFFYSGKFIQHQTVITELKIITGVYTTAWWMDAIPFLLLVPYLFTEKEEFVYDRKIFWQRRNVVTIITFLFGYWIACLLPCDSTQFLKEIFNSQFPFFCLIISSGLIFHRKMLEGKDKKDISWFHKMTLILSIISLVLPKTTMFYLPSMICYLWPTLIVSSFIGCILLCIIQIIRGLSPELDEATAEWDGLAKGMSGFFFGFMGIQALVVILFWYIPFFWKRYQSSTDA